MPSAARREASISRRVRGLCSSSIVMLLVNTNIGRSIKFYVKNVPPSYAMRHCSRTPPPKEDCPICFLPMPASLITCVTLPDATTTSVPMQDFVDAYEELGKMDSEQYYPCCGKTICKGCTYSFIEFENDGKCPFCNSDRGGKSGQEAEELSNRMRANDPASICLLATNYHYGLAGLQQDRTMSMELFTKSADLGHSNHISSWVGIIIQREIRRRPSFTMKPQLWQGTKLPGATLERWNMILETRSEVLSIG